MSRIEMRPIETGGGPAWTVEAAGKPARNFLTRGDAVAFARALGQDEAGRGADAEVVFFRRDGAIDHLESYRVNPTRPSGYHTQRRASVVRRIAP